MYMATIAGRNGPGLSASIAETPAEGTRREFLITVPTAVIVTGLAAAVFFSVRALYKSATDPTHPLSPEEEKLSALSSEKRYTALCALACTEICTRLDAFDREKPLLSTFDIKTVCDNALGALSVASYRGHMSTQKPDKGMYARALSYAQKFEEVSQARIESTTRDCDEKKIDVGGKKQAIAGTMGSLYAAIRMKATALAGTGDFDGAKLLLQDMIKKEEAEEGCSDLDTACRLCEVCLACGDTQCAEAIFTTKIGPNSQWNTLLPIAQRKRQIACESAVDSGISPYSRQAAREQVLEKDMEIRMLTAIGV